MAKRKLSISNLKNVPADIAKEAANAMDGVKKQNNRSTEKQKTIKTEVRKDNITYKTVRINKDLHYKLKVKALEKEMKITDYIEYILERGI